MNPNRPSKQKLLIFFAVILAVGLVVFFFFAVKEKIQIKILQRKCPQLIAAKTLVRGDSLDPVLKSGEEVLVYNNYYQCFDAKLGDIIVYDYAGQKEPIVKFIKAVPGDKFRLAPWGSNKEKWLIYINDKPLQNSEGEYYIINQPRYRMLHIYELDYKNTLPEDVYLILGNVYSGSIDSTMFGLVNQGDFLGKVVK